MELEKFYKKEKNISNLGAILKPANMNNGEKKIKENEIDLENDDKEVKEDIEEVKIETNEDEHTENDNTEDENTENENTENDNTEDENTEDEHTEDENNEGENNEEKNNEEKNNKDENNEENISEKYNIGAVEVHNIYESDDNISRKSSENNANKKDSLKKKKKKAKLNTFMLQSYFHKSYDKVSNALKKTSLPFLKRNAISNEKKIKNIDNPTVNNNNEFTTFAENVQEKHDENNFFDKNWDAISKYLKDNKNLIKNNEKILKKHKKLLENNDTSKCLEELKELLDERILLIKSLIYYDNMSINYKKDLNKYRNSYEILKSENEQLNQNIITLKNHIEFLNSNNIQSSLKKDDKTNDFM
ncbi:conserved Plasmodium protein, unknown function [Plasmodium relictum]|uniref:Uncharacterized protein n=1 Tax=Plasmodium relictum TaxID=85471 RepID=A0A1J1HI27_PLARL|nr:conserved Plasmodium protein, unknown function [Plasmodium relictum]CRH03925.1 conserved Plasmodium protein, unknown function [Plasmodium relictum]